MTIKEMEDKTGLNRFSIRFYEKKGLISPERNKKNGYREYTNQDMEDIQKIAYLRTLGISIEDISQAMQGKKSLKKIIQKRKEILDTDILDVENSKRICQQLLREKELSYESLDITAYTPETSEYWEQNKQLLKVDTVNFFYLWGGFLIWLLITGVSLFTALLVYPNLPDYIPIQWSKTQVSSQAGKIFIFFYPLVCIIARFGLRFCLRWKIAFHNQHINEIVSDYLSNSFCFLMLSAEIFTVLFIHGYVQNIVVLFVFDGIVLLGILIKALIKLS